MLGTPARTIAILGVASIGLMMLTGRIDARRAAQVIIGCFILFGASSIAAGLMNAVGGGRVATSTAPPPAPSTTQPPVTPAPSAGAQPYDPYAGAAVPSR